MRIVFDPSVDRGAWTGPLRSARATVGEAWLGPLGLLDRLETDLGLGGRHASQVDRAVGLAATLDPRSGGDSFWGTSFAADRLGTCHRLLRDRDALVLWGWRGQPASSRLAELWNATAAAAPGTPDRLDQVRGALMRRSIDVESVELLSPLAGLPTAWRAVLGALADRGVRVSERVPATAAPAPNSDLARARRAPLETVGDGSLTLLRAHGPLAAAEEVAASLAALSALGGVVVIGGDALLDGACARHGLPRLGARAGAPASTALIRLVIEAAFEPMEPSDLHALLCLAPGPVPRRVAARLVSALNKFPGRGSSLWHQRWREGIAACDAPWREDVDARLRTLLVATARRDAAIDAADLCRRLHAIHAWALGCALQAVAQRALAALRLVERSGAQPLTLLVLRRLCDELDADHAGVAAEAGLAAVAHPGAVLAPADTIVWWGFTRASAGLPARVRLSGAERSALAMLGVTPPDPGRALEAEAMRWRRPLKMASRTLVLVCPMTDAAGDKDFPHPLWDELVAAMPDRSRGRNLERRDLAGPARRRVAARPLPQRTHVAQAGRPIDLRPQESPSSMELLLGCSLAFALRYAGHLEDGLSRGPPSPSPILYGTLAHHLLARVFASGAKGGDTAAASAARVFDDEVPGLCESLGLPRYQVERTTLRQAVVDSARALGRLMTTLGATVRGVELEAVRALGGVTVGGVADLVLSGPDVIVDLKWGKTSVRQKLVSGTAFQLAAYAELFADGPRPETAYFILKTQELLGEPGGRLPGAHSPGRATAQATWRGAETALAERRVDLARGHLVAPGSDVKASLGERLVLAPPCQYCSFSTLCGQRGAL